MMADQTKFNLVWSAVSLPEKGPLDSKLCELLTPKTLVH